MPIINNVTRMLDAQKIAYTAFETSTEKLGAEETARALDVNIELVYKTIVILRPSPRAKPILVITPGNAEVDLKKLAVFLREKKLMLSTKQEAEKLTGLQAGGISALALINKGFQVVLDDSAQKHAFIHVSGGQRGLNIRLDPQALVRATRARFASVSTPKSSAGEDFV